jgi:FixJ family two-component response regulator
MDPMNTDVPATVAIVDDDPGVRDSLRVLLTAAGFQTREYGSAEAFLREPVEGARCCAIVDLRLPGMDGLALQEEMGRRGLAAPIIVVTAHGDVASARQALRSGAVDFLEKPIDNDELLTAVRGAIDGQDRTQLERAADARATLLLGSLTQREREVYDRIRRAAALRYLRRRSRPRGRRRGPGLTLPGLQRASGQGAADRAAWPGPGATSTPRVHRAASFFPRQKPSARAPLASIS